MKKKYGKKDTFSINNKIDSDKKNADAEDLQVELMALKGFLSSGVYLLKKTQTGLNKLFGRAKPIYKFLVE